MPKKKSVFGDAAAAATTKAAESKVTPKPNLVESRLEAISASQKVIKTQTLLVDPTECVIWERHNRQYDRLNENNCRDLIDSFISAGQQEVPAIVRRVKGRGAAKYEIIAGARRFWTVNWLRENNYPQFQYRIEVRDLTDEEAFRLANLENLDRTDISDYERAIDYKNALDLYYNGKQADMAKRLNKSESWVSRYLTLAKLPVQIANAYADWSDLKLAHAKDLLDLLNNKQTMKDVLQAATQLHAIHQDNELSGAKRISGAEVFRRLKEVAKAKKKSGRGGPIATFGPSDNPNLALKSRNRHALTVVIPTSSGATPAEIITSLRECLKDHYKP
jgi:ParB family chromosome partitioning protein